MDVEARLARLEREVGRWRLAALALSLIGIASAVALGCRRTPEAATTSSASAAPASAPGEVEARRFVLVGGDGKPLAILGPDEAGLPRLALMAGGEPRATLGFWHAASPHLLLQGPGGEAQVDTTCVGLTAYAPGGAERFDLSSGLDTGSGPSLVLSGPDGRSAVQAEVFTRGRPSLSLLGPDGRVVFEAPPRERSD